MKCQQSIDGENVFYPCKPYSLEDIRQTILAIIGILVVEKRVFKLESIAYAIN